MTEHTITIQSMTRQTLLCKRNQNERQHSQELNKKIRDIGMKIRTTLAEFVTRETYFLRRISPASKGMSHRLKGIRVKAS